MRRSVNPSGTNPRAIEALESRQLFSSTFTPGGELLESNIANVEIRGPGQLSNTGSDRWTLLDAGTSEVLGAFSSGSTIDLSKLATSHPDVRVDVGGNSVTGVAFSFDGQRDFAIDTSAPYTLFGGSEWTAAPGGHVIVATPILTDGSRGRSMGVHFTVVGTPAAEPPVSEPPSTIAVSAGNINFGEVTVGGSQTRPLTISNIGTSAAITITSLHFIGADSGLFSSNFTGSLSLAAGESQTVQLKFTPAKAGNFAATLSIESTAANGMQTRNVAGIGNAPAQPTNVSATINWRAGTSVQEALAEAGSIQISNKLYVFGGYGSGLIGQYDTRVLNLDTHVWTTLAPMHNNVPITHFGAATDGKFIFVVAGQAGNGGSTDIRSESWKYSIANNTWTSFTALPEARGGGDLTLINGELHYFSGFIDDRITHSTKHWSIKIDGNGNATSSWVEKAPVPLDVDHFGIAQVNGIIYLIGGEDSHGVDYNQHRTLQAYNPVTNTWAQKALMPVGTSHFEGGVQVINGRILVLGGMEDNEHIINYGRVYDPATNTWSSITGLPYGRKGGVSAWYNNELYYATGNGYNGTSSKAYQTNGWIGTIENLWT